MKYLSLLLVVMIVTGCATQPVWQSSINAERMGMTPTDAKPPTTTSSAPYRLVPSDATAMSIEKDKLECQVFASQAATGVGSGFRDPAIRTPLFMKAKNQYYEQCLNTRGYRWVTTR